ncbi:hypothetical protein ACI2KT_08295 [Ensifer adhaerens]|uniref:hypothetical protein n=1 Tax=Ensifer TaxID=106591 RepID=UPI001AEEFC2A|nr:hypothetical protein [Ensifer sp. ENS08]
MRSTIATGMLVGILAGFATEARAEVPFFNATCPGRIGVHADQGGPVFINGSQARLKRFSSDYYEASQGRTTISISVNRDGSPSISYTRRGAGNGVCRVTSAGGNTRPRPERPPQYDDTQQPDRVDARMMPRFCQGEASAAFGVRPNRITVNMAFRSGRYYWVQGNYDGGRGVTFFNCRFDLRGNFIDVR